MRKMNFITRFLCSCAGCDIATLNQCNTAEQKKMSIIGSCVLITPILGVASGTFAILTFSNNLMVSLGFGLLWGFVIFLIERAIVANTRPGEINLSVFARILLANVFALVISVPMELKVFDDAIQEKLSSNLKRQVAQIDTAYSIQIGKINTAVIGEKLKLDGLRQSYIGEVDGTSGSRVVYRGPIAIEKEKLWKEAESDYNKFVTEKRSDKNLLFAQRKQDIVNIQEGQAQGFLGRMRALGELSREDDTVFWGIWLIRLFFLSIELIPILIKLSSGAGGNIYNEVSVQNGKMAVTVSGKLEEVRAEEMIKQQKAILNKELLDLQFGEEKAVMEDAQRRFDFYMAQLKKASERKLTLIKHVCSTVKEEDARNNLVDKIEEIYENFQRTLTELVDKNKGGDNFIKDLN